MCGMNEHGAGVYTTDGFMDLMDAIKTGPKGTLTNLDLGNNSICGVYLDFNSRVQGKYKEEAFATLCEVVNSYPALTSLSVSGDTRGLWFCLHD